MVSREIPLADWADDQRAIAWVRRLVRDGELRALRERAELTQSVLAGRGGCTPSAISQYESGARVPNRAIAKRLAEALKAFDSSETVE